ncbi:MAG: zf-HC2 domain-containing protein [Deltaproteobacteria bacterium]|nr:zf-HC2 domain-containing protein [Deltaproteobacteria bacterium]
MSCERQADTLMGYLYGELTPPEADAFLAHAKTCASCAEDLKGLGTMRATLARAAPLPDPPAAITARILDAARQAVPSPGVVTSQAAAAKAPGGGLFAWLAKPWAWGVVAAGAGAAALLTVGMPRKEMLTSASAPAAVAEDGLATLSTKAGAKHTADGPAPAAAPAPAAPAAQPALAGAAGDQPVEEKAPQAENLRSAVRGQAVVRDERMKAEKRAMVARDDDALAREPDPDWAQAGKSGGGRALDRRADTGSTAAADDEGGEFLAGRQRGAARLEERKGAAVAELEAPADAQEQKPAADKKKNEAPAPAKSPLLLLPVAPRNAMKDQAKSEEANKETAPGGAYGAAGNVAAVPPAPEPTQRKPATAAARPPPAEAPPAGSAQYMAPVGGELSQDALVLPKARREAERSAAAPEIKQEAQRLKKMDHALRAQTEMSIGAEALAGADPQAALLAFRRAEQLDALQELAPNPKAGQATALARMGQCEDALQLVTTVERSHPAFNQLHVHVRETAKCFERKGNADRARLLTARADKLEKKASVDPAVLATRAAGVNRVVHTDASLMEACETAATARGELPAAQGNWTIRITLDGKGAPVAVAAKGPRNAPVLRTCLESRVRALRFPAAEMSKQEVDVAVVARARPRDNAAPAMKAKNAAPAREADAEAAH